MGFGAAPSGWISPLYGGGDVSGECNVCGTNGCVEESHVQARRLLVAVQRMTALPARLSQRTIDSLPSVWWERLDALCEAYEPFEAPDEQDLGPAAAVLKCLSREDVMDEIRGRIESAYRATCDLYLEAGRVDHAFIDVAALAVVGLFTEED